MNFSLVRVFEFLERRNFICWEGGLHPNYPLPYKSPSCKWTIICFETNWITLCSRIYENTTKRGKTKKILLHSTENYFNKQSDGFKTLCYKIILKYLLSKVNFFLGSGALCSILKYISKMGGDGVSLAIKNATQLPRRSVHLTLP